MLKFNAFQFSSGSLADSDDKVRAAVIEALPNLTVENIEYFDDSRSALIIAGRYSPPLEQSRVISYRLNLRDWLTEDHDSETGYSVMSNGEFQRYISG